jgi:hypothetical protein
VYENSFIPFVYLPIFMLCYVIFSRLCLIKSEFSFILLFLLYIHMFLEIVCLVKYITHNFVFIKYGNIVIYMYIESSSDTVTQTSIDHWPIGFRFRERC